MKMFNNNLGLALGAGGARGAYEAGVLLHLAEMGLQFTSVSGASIGALNGAFYAQYDGSITHVEKLISLWLELPTINLIKLKPDVASDIFNIIFDLHSFPIGIIKQIIHTLSSNNVYILDPQPLTQLMDKWIDYTSVCSSPTNLHISVLPTSLPVLDIVWPTKTHIKYLPANSLTPNKLKTALLASAAIPFAFPSQELEGSKLVDAGFADPIPAQILYNNGCRQIVSVFLSDAAIQNRLDLPACKLLQIRPSINIDTGLQSTFDFSKKTIENLIQLGYNDTKNYFSQAGELATKLTTLTSQGDKIQELANLLPKRH